MTSYLFYFDLITAAAWFAMSAAGIVLRVRRLVRLNRIILAPDAPQHEHEYLASIKRSTWLRLGTKVVFLIGALIALFNLPLFVVWRIGILVALGFMIWETRGVDRIRDRLGRSMESEP